MKDFTKTKTYKDVIENKMHCYFVSPHLDDAVFSAGGLMYNLTKRHVPITLINVFTSASEPPYTLSIKKFLYSCGYKDANDLFKDRISEDLDVAKKINIQVVNLGFVDALWRHRKVTDFGKIIANLIPEYGYLYPIYKMSIAKGTISDEDQDMQSKLIDNLNSLVNAKDNAIIFGPSGIGKHTDHLIVRNCLDKISNKNLVYWGDYPYFEKDNIDINFKALKRLSDYKFKTPSKAKENLVMGYKSQISAIFGKNKIDFSKEVYFV